MKLIINQISNRQATMQLGPLHSSIFLKYRSELLYKLDVLFLKISK